MTDDQIQQRIADYRDRYAVTEVNDAGFPVFPAGLRESPQHREWISLYQLFNRARRRSGGTVIGDGVVSRPCPVCQRPSRPPGSTHQRCAIVVDVLRELGPESVDRIRAAAFPDDGEPSIRPRSKRKA